MLNGIGQHGVVDVVLERDREDTQVDVARPDRAQLRLIERDHARGVELLQIVVDALALAAIAAAVMA
jgi:hypothetical protein